MFKYKLVSGEPQVFNNYGGLLMSNNCLPSCINYILEKAGIRDLGPEEVRHMIMNHLDYHEMADYIALLNATDFMGMEIVIYGKMGLTNKLKSYKTIGVYNTQVGLVLMKNHYWVITDATSTPLIGYQLPEIIEDIEFDPSMDDDHNMHLAMSLSASLGSPKFKMDENDVAKLVKKNIEITLYLKQYTKKETENIVREIVEIVETYDENKDKDKDKDKVSHWVVM